MSYAESTTVPVERSRAEIEKIVTRYGAVGYASGWQNGEAQVIFEAHARRVRFTLKLPMLAEFIKTKGGQRRSKGSMETARAQEERRRWRALALTIKAKLEAVESGIASFEEEFLAHIILPGTGETIGTWIAPKLVAAYNNADKMPPMLPSGPVKP